MSLIAELKRRNVFRVGAVYAIVAWLLIEVASVVLPTFKAPDWVMQVCTFLVIFGFPLALVFAWAFELTPEGIKRETGVDPDESVTHVTGRKLDFAIIGLLAVALIFVVVDNYILEAEPEQAEVVFEQIPVTELVAQVGSTPIRSVAVLPLHDSSSDEVGGYLSFGMTEALITELAKLGGLNVISRTSVTPYETTDLSIRQIAAELGVDAIIEGSVLRSGERIRVTAQLIDARSDTHIWAESYERDAGDVLALQAELARAIAREVQIEVSLASPVGSGSARPISPAAYEAYLKGYYFQMKRTREDTERAVRYFMKVIELEPDHPLGYSGLADEYSCAPTHSWSLASSELWPSVPREMTARARSNAQRALVLDPTSGPAHNSIALVHMFGNWDWSAAEAAFLRSIELSPSRAWAHSSYAYFLAFQRRFDEAIVHLERARALDPLRVETTMDMAALQVWIGNRDEAYRLWQEAEEIMPGYAGLHQAVVTGFCGTERHAEALAVLEGANATFPEDPLIIGETAYCHAVAGGAPRAHELLAELDGLAGALYVSPVSRAMVHVGLGDHDRAFEELKRGIRERAFLLPYIGVDRTWDPLRADPRFSELLDHIGLPQA